MMCDAFVPLLLSGCAFIGIEYCLCLLLLLLVKPVMIENDGGSTQIPFLFIVLLPLLRLL